MDRERGENRTRARRGRFPAAGILSGAALRQFGLGHRKGDGAGGNVDLSAEEAADQIVQALLIRQGPPRPA